MVKKKIKSRKVQPVEYAGTHPDVDKDASPLPVKRGYLEVVVVGNDIISDVGVDCRTRFDDRDPGGLNSHVQVTLACILTLV